MTATGPTIILAPLDGRSDLSGADNGCNALRDLLDADKSVGRKLEYFPRSYGEVLDFQIYHSVRRCVRRGEAFVVVGGDHSCSYSSALAVSSLLGDMTIIHLDAHHDRHPVPFLCNYSLFHHLSRLPSITTHSLGNRDERQPYLTCEALDAIDTSQPVYISFDVDWYAPTRVASVNFPIPKPDDQDVALFFDWIDRVRPQICGADLVEWTHSLNRKDGESDFVFQLFHRICSLVSR
jgi:arginase family enzyme